MNKGIRLKLFLMMVLQFFIWGAWLPLIFGYLPSLGFSATNPPPQLAFIANNLPSWLAAFFSEQAMILNAFPIAAIVGMFFSNQFADRNFAAQRFLAFSHFIGGLAILSCGFARSFWAFYSLMLVHCLLYVPTISITNSIAFAAMKDAKQEFGIVRMGGTIGWILAAWPFTFIFVDWTAVNAANPHGLVAWIGEALSHPLTGAAAKAATKWTYIVSGVASLALAAFSFTLPHTPAKKVESGETKFAWLEALRLLKHPFILVLWLVTLVDSTVHNSYFMWTGSFLGTPVEKGGVGIASNWIMPVMSIGQIAEILTMFVLGATLKRLGWKWTMVFGILGHAARFGVYAFFPQHAAMIILVQVLHGICYAFFFATVYIFVEEFFPKDARSSAQGLFNVMILGVGALIAATFCPGLFSAMTNQAGVTNFKSLFLIPFGCAVAGAIILALFFHPPKSTKATTGSGTAPSH